MFDFGFGELLLIAVVALVVLGPERLPKVARLAGLWARKARAQWNAVKAELENEIADEELRRSLRETSAAMREGSAALRDGMQQMRALPDTVRNDPAVVDTMAVMTSLNAGQGAAQQMAATHSDAVGRAPVEQSALTPGVDDAASQPDHDPAQMSLLDADPQLSLFLPIGERPSDD